mgnify:CR=1 FL=1
MAEVLLEGKGYDGGTVGAGVAAALSLGKTKEARVSQAHGAHFEAARRGNVFAGATAVGGVDHAATNTTTAPLALYNPVGSNVDLVVIELSMGYISGTLGAGVVIATQYLVGQPSNAVPTGTAIVATPTRLGSTRSVGQPLTTVTLTAAGTVLPTTILMLVMIVFFFGIKDSPNVKAMLTAVRPVVIGLLVWTAYDMARTVLGANKAGWGAALVGGWDKLIIAAAAFGLLTFTAINPVFIILGAAVFGLMVYR